MFARVLACAVLLSTAGTAAAAEPKQPNGKWVVNFADAREVWKVWDYDKEPSGLKEGPSGNLSGIFSGDDYPGIAVFKDQMGSVGFVLLIDEQGKVVDCTITETSWVASLDAQSCAIVKERAKFKPAIGLDGKPSKSSYFERISWRLEG